MDVIVVQMKLIQLKVGNKNIKRKEKKIITKNKNKNEDGTYTYWLHRILVNTQQIIARNIFLSLAPTLAN